MLTVVMRFVQVPAALMLGPIMAAVLVAIYLPGPRLAPALPLVAQSILGCLIARLMPPHLLATLLPGWPILLGMNLLSTLAIMALGVVATHMRWLPGTAAIWGMSPGGASAMVLLSETHGSDKRLVALMQYLRVVMAALSVIVIGSLFGTPHVGPMIAALPGAASTSWMAPVDLFNLAVTAGLAGISILLTAITRKRVLVVMIPVFGGISLEAGGLATLDVPPLAAAVAFAVIGWHIGLSFTRASLLHSARMMPRILGCILAILTICAALSVLFARIMEVDFLTAYMALNPGGTDAVMAMAASVAVDLPLILAMQIVRLIIVMLIAPLLGRLAAERHLRTSGRRTGDSGSEALADDADIIV